VPLFAEQVLDVVATHALVVFKPALQLGIVTGIVTVPGMQFVPLQTFTFTGQAVGPAAGAVQVVFEVEVTVFIEVPKVPQVLEVQV